MPQNLKIKRKNLPSSKNPDDAYLEYFAIMNVYYLG